jgi:hypothetical protein
MGQTNTYLYVWNVASEFGIHWWQLHTTELCHQFIEGLVKRLWNIADGLIITRPSLRLCRSDTPWLKSDVH